ncbi:battenin-like [Liolophura sinensis]|uniref:battenin-like n=1 Tax=Liolophura sinensis TaxID=3198878 RepID=UPI0031583C5C
MSNDSRRRHTDDLYDENNMEVSDEESSAVVYNKSNLNSWRNLIAFWVLGLCNNFAYVVMLSAAHDILDQEEAGSNSTSVNTSTGNLVHEVSGNDSTLLECNPIGTGAILLADILPTLVVKLTAPFYIQVIPYRIKVILVILFALGSFLLVALSQTIPLSILGVVCASISAGLGEPTFLGLSTFFDRNVISSWSSGTGGAGVLGALSYAGLTSLGVSPRTSVLIMTCVPVLMAFSYFVLLDKPDTVYGEKIDSDAEGLLSGKDKYYYGPLTWRRKLQVAKPLLYYMVPLTLVYFAEYFINQGLHEVLYFNGIWLSPKEQYRWFQVDYQIGVFISRSSVNFIKINHLWALPVLQFVNLIILLTQVLYRYIPNVWIVFAIVLFEGLLGGGAYVNTFYKMSKEIPPEIREYSLSVATISDSAGIAVAGAVAIPVHNAICSLNIHIP